MAVKSNAGVVQSLRSRPGLVLIPVNQIRFLLECVQRALPREASGLLLREDYGHGLVLTFVPTSIYENTSSSFLIRTAAIKRISESLRGSPARIGGCFHSHTVGPAFPSKPDCAATKGHGDIWLIYSVRFRDLKLFCWNSSKFENQKFRIVPPRPGTPVRW